jgi:uncharacterized protein YbjT (DUF2867 family)
MILVTGASGTVGTEVVKALAAQGARFRAGYHSKPDRLRGTGAEAVPLDYDRPETLGPALAGVDTVFLLSRTVAPEVAVVRAAKAAGVRRIVKLSVWGAAEEAFAFAKWHRPVEKEIEATGLQWTFVRPNGFMQNIPNFFAWTIKSQGAFYTACGDARISHVDVRDVAAVAARALTEDGHAGKAYELSGPRALTYGEIAEVLSKVLGRKINHVSVSDADLKKGAVAAGISEDYADALTDLNRAYREGKAGRVTPDVKTVTGRDPIAFEAFAQDYQAALA